MIQRMKSSGVAFLAGSCVIYAILWLLANYTSLPGSVLMLLVPIVALWLALCVAWTLKGRSKE
jgi:hypothetical protein